MNSLQNEGIEEKRVIIMKSNRNAYRIGSFVD